MADFSALIAQIEAYVKQNGNNEITGNGLQSILVGMVNALGTVAITALQGDLADEVTARQNADGAINAKIPAEASSSNKLADKAFVTTLTDALQSAIDTINANIGNGYVYAGVATPSGTPVSGKVVYLTAQAGTYTNYGGLVVPTGISVLKYNGTTWSQEQVMSMADIYRNPLMGLFDCSTAGATAAKVVTADGYVLPTNGGSMKVRMANHTTVDNVTLNINGTGAKTLYYKGKAAGINNTWGDGAILNVMYDSTNSIYLAYDANAGTGDGVFDISDYTGDTYEDLEAALADVPVSERHGGMMVRFIQGSAPSVDNNYLQFRLMADEWSTNTEDWAIADEGVYTENPEFVYVKKDSEDKILWAIRTDGSIYYGAGVPPQVKDYIEERISNYDDILTFLDDLEEGDETLRELLNEKVDKEEGKSLIDEDVAEGIHYEENPEFVKVELDAEDKVLEGIQKDGTKVIGGDLRVLGNMEVSGVSYKVIENPEYLAAWVDAKDNVVFGLKTNGKTYVGDAYFLDDIESIKAFLANLNDKNIDWDALTSITATENPEYIEVKTDAEDKILEATEKDGTKVFGGNVKVLGSIDIDGVSNKVVTNSEWLKVVLDSENRIICGIKTDGRFVVYIADFLDDIEAINARLEELDAYSVTENPEFLEAELDADDKVLSGRKVDGTKFENNDAEINGNATIGGSLEVDGVVIKNIEDPEGRNEITLDSEDKIVSYRKEDGTKVENVGFETPKVQTKSVKTKDFQAESLNLSEENAEEIKKALNDIGFTTKAPVDWTDAKSVEIPEPRCAVINIINPNGATTWPTTKTADLKYVMQFWDNNGNYFQKEIILNAQGDSSLSMAKKNGSIDICNNNGWDDDDTFKLKIGDWVAQDSFHWKAYYTDKFRGISIIAYKLYNEAVLLKPSQTNRSWKRALINAANITDTTIDPASNVENVQYAIDNGARCIPDGFPCVIFLDGVFHGIYSWNLKKHRDNYCQKKDNVKHILLDGYVNNTVIFNGVVDWTAFEVRNPKKLVYAESHADLKGKQTYKYDADDAGQFEIAGNNSSTFDIEDYDSWVSGTAYPVNKIVERDGHLYINTVAGNTDEPLYDAEKNSDKEPDYKNKTGCGWINCTNTCKVKSYIIAMSHYCAEIDPLTIVETTNGNITIGEYGGEWNAETNFGKGIWVSSGDSYYMSIHSSNTGNPVTDENNWVDITEALATLKAKIEKYYDVESVIDYCALSLPFDNYDGFSKNWLWDTWDGKKWFCEIWDCDSTFGGTPGGWIAHPARFSMYGVDYKMNNEVTQTKVGNYIKRYYWRDVQNKYAQLRDAKILDVHHIMEHVRNWLLRYGYDNYKKEFEKWSASPCNRQMILNNGWEIGDIDHYHNHGLANYDATRTYNVGDECKYQYLVFKATGTVTGVAPMSQSGHFDNIYRLENWINERLRLEDSYLNYNNQN